MSSGSIVLAGLEFVSYRIIEMQINTRPLIRVLLNGLPAETEWEFGLGFGDISFEPQSQLYIVPLSSKMQTPPSVKEQEKNEATSTEESSALVSVVATMAGAFRFTKDCVMTEEVREKMIRHQAPAIMMPYLRAVVSTMLANAGFHGVIPPLVNVNAMAKDNPPVRICQLGDEENKH